MRKIKHGFYSQQYSLSKSLSSPHPTNARHIRLIIKRTTVIFFECEDTVLQEFVPLGQTVQPALLLGGFATSEEGSPPKMYGMIAEQSLVDSL
jgi:hypothetical protein